MTKGKIVKESIGAGDERKAQRRYFHFRKDGEQRLAWISNKGKSDPILDVDVSGIENHELPDGTSLVYDYPGKWQCRKCAAVFHTRANPPLDCNECERRGTFDRVNPAYITEPWIPYGEPKISLHLEEISQMVIDFLGKYLVLPRERDYEVLSWWVIATYLQHNFWTFPYLQFIAPIRSGKTTALQLLSMLAYNCVDAIAITPSALSRLIEKYKCTVLIDQGENKFNLKSDRGQELYDIFMGGYKKGQKHIVSDKEDADQVIIRHEFGPKAIASTRLFDLALTDRSIVLHLREGVPPKEDITKETIAEAEEIRNTLAGLCLCIDDMEPIEIDLHGRTREKYAPLIRTCDFLDGDTKTLYEYAREQEERQRNEITNSDEHAILKVIRDVQNRTDEIPMVEISYIAEQTGFDPRKIGWKLKDMNIERKKLTNGVHVSLEDPHNQDELDYLYKKFNVDND